MKTEYDEINDVMTFTVSDDESYGEEKNGITTFYSLNTNYVTGVVIENYSKRLPTGELDFLNLPKVCDKCGKRLLLTKKNYAITINGNKIVVKNTPVFQCSCGKILIEDRTTNNINTFLENTYMPDDTYNYPDIVKQLKNKK